MTIISPVTPLPIYDAPYKPLSNITPFTIRDGYSYLEKLERLQEYLNVTLVNFINENFGTLGDEFELEVNKVIDTVNASLTEQTNNVNSALTAMETYVNEAVASIINSTIAVTDPVTYAIINNLETATRELIDKIFYDSLAINTGVVYAHKYGVKAGVAADQKSYLHAAFAAAEALGGGAVVQLPSGSVQINGTFSLNGYSSGMRGAGASAKSLTPVSVETGTVLVGVAQTGAVIDFTGFVWPNAQRGRALFENFAVKGDGVVNTLNKGIALVHPVSGSSVEFRNIVIYNTGGVGLHVKNWYLSEFHGVIVHNPVNASINDTPYVLIEGGNGNRWYGLGLRSLIFDDTADVGVSGALVTLPGTTYQAHKALFVGGWAENLHVPQNGTIIYNKANEMVYQDFEFFDCFKVAGAVNTSHYIFDAPAAQNYGGNILRGTVPGKGTGPLDIDAGVKLNQRNNLLDGPKGYNGANVIISAGVEGCTVHLRGGVANPTAIGITDNSGMTSNTLIDEFSGLHILGGNTGATPNLKVGSVEVLHKRNSYTLAANAAPNMITGINSFRYTLNANITITMPTNIQDKLLYITVIQDAVGGRVATFSAAAGAYKFPGGVQPAKSTAANAIDRYTFEWSGTYWECISVLTGL